MTPAQQPDTYVFWSDAQSMFGGISRTTAWRLVRSGQLPRPHEVSPGRKAWPLSSINAWQQARAEQAENN